MVSQGRLSGEEWDSERREPAWRALPGSEWKPVTRYGTLRSFVVFGTARPPVEASE